MKRKASSGFHTAGQFLAAAVTLDALPGLQSPTLPLWFCNKVRVVKHQVHTEA